MSSGQDGRERSERVTVNASVAIRSELGFYFGMLRWIDGERALVEITAPLEDGEALDIRITLSPTRATALFRGRVGRALVTAEGEEPRYLIQLDACAPGDRELYKGWLQNVRNRGTFSNFDTVVSGYQEADPRASAEIRKALERLSRRPGAARAEAPFGPDSDLITNPGAVGAGRGAVRDALRSAIARTAGGRGAVTTGPAAPAAAAPSTPPSTPTPSTPPGAPSRPPVAPLSSTPSTGPGRVVASTHPGGPAARPPSVLPYEPPAAPVHTPAAPVHTPADRIVRIGHSDPTRSAAPPSRAPVSHAPGAQAPVSRAPASRAPVSRAPVRDAAPAAHPPVRDPTYATTATRTTTWMEVQWHDAETFERDARLQLCNYILVVARAEAPLPDREPIRLAVRHGGFQLDCNAVVKAMGPNGATYRLDFDALQMERLKAWVADYGRK